MILPSRSSAFSKPLAFRHGEHPAHLAAALLGVGERGDAGHVEAALDHPVDAGEAGVENAVIDVARHLLRANQHALDLGVVDGGKVGAAVGVDVPAGALEERDGRVLQAAFGNAETKFVSHGPPPLHCRVEFSDRPGEAAYGALVADQAVAFHLHAEQQRVVVAVG